MKRCILIAILSIILFSIFSCNKTTKPQVSSEIKGQISFYDGNGNLIDSLITATIDIYGVETFIDSLKEYIENYNNVFSNLPVGLLTDYRKLGQPIKEIITTGSFKITGIDLTNKVLVYSAPNFGWHYKYIEVAKKELKLKMRQKLVISYGISNNDVEWGPDQFIYIPNDLYCYGNLTIHENTLIALENSGIEIFKSLNCLGTQDNPIIFTSNEDDPNIGDWKQINFNSSSNQSSLNYTIIRWSNFGLRIKQKINIKDSAILNCNESLNCLGSYFEFENSLIAFSDYGLKIYSTDSLSTQPQIKNSIIYKNKEIGTYIMGSSPIIQNNIFAMNYEGIAMITEGGHSHYGTNPIIEHCDFLDCTKFSISSNRTGPTIEYCNFINFNKEVHYFILCYNTYNTVITNTNFIIYDNIYNVIRLLYRSGGSEVNAKNNWWGTTQEAEIQDLIYDENDEPGGNNVGYVEYEPWKTQKINNAGPQ